MAIVSTGIPLFAGIEDVDDMFIATMEEMDKEVTDDLPIAHPFWEYMTRHDLVEYREEIATHVPVRRRLHRNPTVQWHSGYDDADSTPAQVLGEVRFPYGHITGRQMYNREELVKNQGSQLIDLVEAKASQAYTDVRDEFATALIGTQDADGRMPLGLGRIMDETATVAGLAPGDDPTWKPDRIYKTGTTDFSLSTEFRDGMRKVYRHASVSAGGRVLGRDKDGKMRFAKHVLLCGEDLYNEHQKWAETAMRLTMAELKDSSGWGDYEMFDFNGKTIIYEPALSAKHGWFLDLDQGVRVRVHSGTNFIWTKWNLLPNKVETKYRDLLCYVSVYSRSRKANKKIVFS
ncbi:MAG: phage major capsid protein [Gammaproteobacteria bacterium]